MTITHGRECSFWMRRDESVIYALTTVQITLGFASYNFPVALQYVLPNCTLFHAITYTNCMATVKLYEVKLNVI